MPIYNILTITKLHYSRSVIMPGNTVNENVNDRILPNRHRRNFIKAIIGITGFTCLLFVMSGSLHAQTQTHCRFCNGTGVCVTCDGSGKRIYNPKRNCTVCKGSGVCSLCDGKGTVSSARAQQQEGYQDMAQGIIVLFFTAILFVVWVCFYKKKKS